MRGLAAIALAGYASIRSPNALREETLFIDTTKPNALWTLPEYDTQQQLFSLKRTEMQEFRAELQEQYDVRIVRVGSKNALYQAIDTTPDIALWVFSGHGSRTTVVLQNCVLCPRDASRLDVEDTELKLHVTQFTPEAVIYLDTCNGGEGRELGHNLANTIAASTGKNVYSSDDEIQWKYMTIHHWYPFSIGITAVTSENGWVPRDATYVAQPRFLKDPIRPSRSTP